MDARAGVLVPGPLFRGHQIGIELLAVELLALDGQVGLGVDGIAEVGEFDRQAGAGHLVLVPAGNAAQVSQFVPHRSGEVRDGEVVVLLHEQMRVAACGHENGKDRLAPELADRPPRNRHQVHVPFLPGRYRQPVLVNHPDGVQLDLRRGNLLPGLLRRLLGLLRIVSAAHNHSRSK